MATEHWQLVRDQAARGIKLTAAHIEAGLLEFFRSLARFTVRADEERQKTTDSLDRMNMMKDKNYNKAASEIYYLMLHEPG